MTMYSRRPLHHTFLAPWTKPIVKATPESEAFIERLFSPVNDVGVLAQPATKPQTGEQKLAFALLNESIQDAEDPTRKFRYRDAARAWLRGRYQAILGAEMCCALIGFDYPSMLRRLEAHWALLDSGASVVPLVAPTNSDWRKKRKAKAETEDNA